MSHGTTKIVVIGAGSASFAIESLAGIFRTPGLRGSELALVDIDAAKLSIVEQAAHRLNREWDAQMKITASTERQAMLENAGFVILSVAIDRETTWQHDFELACRWGITHYAENGGPGAFAHTCRNLALIVPILRDIEALCPDALLLNFTNPLTRINHAIQKLSHVRHVGLCHQIGHAYFMLATALHEDLGVQLAVDPRFLWTDRSVEVYEEFQRIAKQKYAIKAAGINHFTWILSVCDRTTGEEILPYFREKLLALPPSFEPLTRKVIEIYGAIPVNGDTHISEYLPFTSDAREGTWKRFDIQLYDFEWSNQRRERTLRFLHGIASGTQALDSLKDSLMSERVEYIIDAILRNARTYEEAVNIPNRGYIANLPENAIVEVPGVVDTHGISGVHVGALPEAIAALCRLQLTIDDLNVEAYMNGDRSLVRQMFAIDPMIQDPDVAIQLADAYIDANLEYLPTFQ